MNSLQQRCEMRRFCDDKYYKTFATMHWTGRYMVLDDPVILSAFVAYCSSRRRRVFLRGTVRDYPTSFPSLFRDPASHDDQCSPEQRKRRWCAYRIAVEKLALKLKPKGRRSRWRRENIGAVLQHYGMKTPWLDAVTNVHTAVWFATHDLETGRTSHGGWISVYVRRHTSEQKRLKVIDLRGYQSSMHFRPHAQQGLGLAMQEDTETVSVDQNFNNYRIANIHLRCSPKWSLFGHMLSTQFLLPQQDDSLQQLQDPDVQSVLDSTCTENDLPPGSLGRVPHYVQRGRPAGN